MYLEAQRGDTKKPGTFPEEGPVFAFTLWKKATKLSDIIEWRKTEKKLKQRGLKMSDRRKWGKEKRRIGECREKSNYLPASGCYDSSRQAGRAAAYCKAFIITVHQPIFPPHAFSSHNFSMCTARELLNPLSYLWLQLCSVFVGLWTCMLVLTYFRCVCLFICSCVLCVCARVCLCVCMCVHVCCFCKRLLCWGPLGAIALSKQMPQRSPRAVCLFI